MKKILLVQLVIAIFSILPSDAHAVATVSIWNTAPKPAYEPGDVINVLIQHSLDEEFSEIIFGTATRDVLRGGWNEAPFITKMNSSDGQKKDVWIEFTIPEGFSDQDTAFRFSSRLRRQGTNYVQPGHQWITVRGLPKKLAPKENAVLPGVASFDWGAVAGAQQYQMEVSRVVDGAHGKQPRRSGVEIVLDTMLTSTSLSSVMLDAGNYTWRVRAQAEDAWKNWSDLANFSVESASITSLDRSHGVRLFPQPASDVVFIESAAGVVQRARIYDMNGRLVSTQGNISGILCKLDVEELPLGTYTIVLEIDEREVIVPLIKR